MVMAGDYASKTFLACWSLVSSRSSRASSLRIPATFSSCLPICSRTISTGVFLIQGLRMEVDGEVDGAAVFAAGVPADAVFCAFISPPLGEWVSCERAWLLRKQEQDTANNRE